MKKSNKGFVFIRCEWWMTTIGSISAGIDFVELVGASGKEMELLMLILLR